MEDLHARDIVHADLKPDNSLVDKRNMAVLTDFGSTMFLAATPFNTDTSDRIEIARYMSAERLYGQGIGKEDDVYAFAIIIYSLWCKKEPFGELHTNEFYAILEDVCGPSNLRPEVPVEVELPEDLESLMKRFWAPVAQDRPTCTEIVQALLDITQPRESNHSDTEQTVFVDNMPGDAGALFALAEGFRHGIDGHEHSLDSASHVYLRAAEFGHGRAQHELSFFYRNGLGVLPKDFEAAFRWCHQAASQGFVESEFDLGECFYWGQGTVVDKETSVSWWQKAAERGHVKAQFNLVACYNTAQLGAFDQELAAFWFRKAAEQGDPAGQFRMGIFYERGIGGVEQNDTTAFEWYSKSAVQGYLPAYVNLGSCYQHGRGVEQDIARAVQLYEEAAMLGDSDAQVGLGMCYSNGDGVEEDLTKSFEWYLNVAEQGNELAKMQVSRRYQNGLRVEKDPELARKWFDPEPTEEDKKFMAFLESMKEGGQGEDGEEGKNEENGAEEGGQGARTF
ncbi:HCP-like protein [Gonapodya prolifera JEL478]|uniref:HCP-like protein n=1 Tax=Gonapodya prolifera (strain JEL478) TaxID=1344416 RepID=A0A139AS58_GONPJ|nr:HCP-like protein [Gonapodya prolifera JEL478]|eukprot:KXS19570.1 HCP-like protein [Gonapodya prolifera JEL478]